MKAQHLSFLLLLTPVLLTRCGLPLHPTGKAIRAITDTYGGQCSAHKESSILKPGGQTYVLELSNSPFFSRENRIDEHLAASGVALSFFHLMEPGAISAPGQVRVQITRMHEKAPVNYSFKTADLRQADGFTESAHMICTDIAAGQYDLVYNRISPDVTARINQEDILRAFGAMDSVLGGVEKSTVIGFMKSSSLSAGVRVPLIDLAVMIRRRRGNSLIRMSFNPAADLPYRSLYGLSYLY